MEAALYVCYRCDGDAYAQSPPFIDLLNSTFVLCPSGRSPASYRMSEVKRCTYVHTRPRDGFASHRAPTSRRRVCHTAVLLPLLLLLLLPRMDSPMWLGRASTHVLIAGDGARRDPHLHLGRCAHSGLSLIHI